MKLIRYLIVTSIVILTFVLGTTVVFADEHTVTDGDTFDLDTVNDGDTISVAAGATVTIKHSNGISKSVQILCAEGVSLTFDGVNIDGTGTNNFCALSFTGTGNTLTITNENTLKSGLNQPGIKVIDGTELAIGGGGTLNSQGGDSGAGIGAGENANCGTVNITSGNINAAGGEGGAGIGGGFSYYGSNGGIINISGGTVMAEGNSIAAGIGGGNAYFSGGNGGTVTISNGAEVYAAKGGNGGKDIGAGSSTNQGSLEISGNATLVFIKSGEEFGGINNYSENDFTFSTDIGVITNKQGALFPDKTPGGVYFYTTLNSMAVAEEPAKTTYNEGESLDLSGLVVTLTYSDGSSENVDFVDFEDKGITTNPTNGTALSHSHTSITISCNGWDTTQALTIGNVITDGDTFDLDTVNDGDTISVAAGATVTIKHSNGISKSVQILCAEGVSLTLDGVNIDGTGTNNFCALSFTGTGNTLTITNENTLKSGLNQPGIKVIDGTELAIGGGGTLNSQGGDSGAGIGAGENANCGTVNITSGNINAAGGEGGAGIGGGFSYYGSNGGIINISGGTVMAEGNSIAAGIGGGNAYFSGGNGGTVTISNGAEVYAAKGGNGGKDIGAGGSTNQGSLEISGNATLVFIKSGEEFGGINNYSENDFTFSTDIGVITNKQGALFPDKTPGGVYFYTTLNSMAVAEEPAKTSYNQGESLDLSGLVVTLIYSDGSSENVGFVDFEDKGITTNPTNGTAMEAAVHDGNPVTITCSGQTAATSNLTVVSVGVTVTGIAVAEELAKTSYNEGESLDLSGLVVTLIYSDGSSENVGFVDFEDKGITTNPTNGTAMEAAVHDGNPVTITCSGQTAATSNLTVVSVGVTVTGIAVAIEPTKTTYNEGESLDLSGLVVTLIYSDGSSENVDFVDFEDKGITTNPTNGTALSHSHTSITISCNGWDTTQALTIGNVITDGDTFDLDTVNDGDTISVAAGATVTIKHSNGISKSVQILCAEGVSLTLDGVNIDGTGTNNFCALSFTGTGNTLTITNENTLKSGLNQPGIKVIDGTELAIGGGGTLNSQGGDSGAGIGAGENANCGTVNITSGNINAAGGEGGAGIGGGFSYYGSNGGIINISGGTVMAEGNSIAAGIGGGNAYFSGGNGGTVTISNGAEVYAAKGGNGGKDIGAGSSTNQGSLEISGNATLVFIKSGEEFGGINNYSENDFTFSTDIGVITNKQGALFPDKTPGGVYFYTTLNSMAVAEEPAKTTYNEGESLDLSGLVVTLTYSDGSSENVDFVDFEDKGITTNPTNGTALSHSHTSITISCNGWDTTQALTIGNVITDGDTFDLDTVNDGDTISVAAGATVTIKHSNGISKSVQILCAEGVSLTLDGVNIDGTGTNNFCALSFTGTGNTLTITNENTLKSGLNQPGIKVIDGTELAIGGGGTLNSQGGDSGAGIGAGENANCGTVNITSGNINAAGGEGGAGIGGGFSYYGSNGGIINISGGTVMAEGNSIAAGIGGGNAYFSGGNGGTVTISNGAEVYAAKGGNGGKDIGAGGSTNQGSLEISGNATLVFIKSGEEFGGINNYSENDFTFSTDIGVITNKQGALFPDKTPGGVYFYTTLNSMAVAEEPAKTSYNQGESLDLSGLVVTLIYSDGSSENVGFVDFEDKGITTNPTNGTAMEAAVHDGNPVTITCSGQTAATSNLTVVSVGVTVTGIAVAEELAKTSYNEGESLDLSGLVVTLIYSDGSSENVGFVDFEDKGITTNPTNGTAMEAAVHDGNPVTITCSGQTAATSNLTVVSVGVTVTGIAVAIEPTKTTYNEGESLDLSGLVVTLTYSDGSSENVDFVDFEDKGITTNPTNGTAMEAAVHDGNPVTITCSGQTAATSNLTVVSVGVTVTGIAVAEELAKTSYNEGESLDLSGLVVTLIYSDGSSENVGFVDFEDKGITTNPTNGTAMEAAVHDGNPVTITCSGQTAATSNLTVVSVGVTVTGIAVAIEPTKTTYNEGESLDLSGLVVTLIYSDGSSENVDFVDFEDKGITTNPTNGTALSHSHTSITISCNGWDTTQALTIGNVITDGDTFDLDTVNDGDTISVAAGATVTIKHSNGISKSVQILCAEGVSLTFDGVNIDGTGTNNFCALSFTGTGNTLTITNENTLKSGLNQPGIKVIDGTELAIGGGGTLNSQGGDSGAGIGAGENANCGTVNITSGNINAAGGEGGAGIGGGFSYYDSNGGIINISGGTVMAEGNGIAAGIGGGNAYFSGGNGGTVTISNGAEVYAAKGGNGGKDIGAGSSTNQGSLNISGNETVVFLANDLVGPSPILSTSELGHYIENNVVAKANALDLGEPWINAKGGYFIPIPLNITYDGNGNTEGTVPIDNSSYLPGAEVTIYGNTGSLARTGYTFNGWNTEADGGGIPYSGGTVFNITEDTILYAQWKEAGFTHIIRATAGTGGSIAPNGDVRVAEGADQTFNISANSGYRINDVVVTMGGGATVSVGAVSQYTFNNITTNGEINVTFTRKGSNSGSSDGEKTPTMKVKEAIEKAKPNSEGVKKVRAKIDTNSKGKVSLIIPNNFVTDDSTVELTVQTDGVSITISSHMFTGDEKSIEISIESVDVNDLKLSDEAKEMLEGMPIFYISISTGDKDKGFESRKSIKISFTVDNTVQGNKLVAVYIDENGNIEILKQSMLNNGVISFNTDHLGKYGVIYIEKSFDDILTHWAKEAVEALAVRGVIMGTSETTFDPKSEITRADFITLLTRCFEFESDLTNSFIDVETDKYYSNPIATAKSLGILDTVNGEFKPLEAITITDIMVYLEKAIKVAGIEFETTNKSANTYSDFVLVEDYARESVEYLISTGLFQGSNNMINPTNTKTRAEIVEMLYNMLLMMF